MTKYSKFGITFSFATALLASSALADIIVGVQAPITGENAVYGQQLQHGGQQAVDDLNAAGGVNGEKILLEIGDDACDPKQAVAAANQLASKKVKIVIGGYCSSSSIPASKVYADEGILQITPASTNPKFTDEGDWNVARVCGRDDAQGAVAGGYLAKHFAGKKVAIIDDKSTYGKGLADETRKAMNAAGLKEVINEEFNAGEKDYTALVSKLKETGVDAVYIGGYHPEAGLILKQLTEQGSNALMFSGDALANSEFWAIAGEAAAKKMMFTFAPDPRSNPNAKDMVAKFKASGYEPEGYTLNTYAAFQMWAQAATAVKSTDPKKVSDWLRAGNEVKTVIGALKLDKNGDILNPKYVWYKFDNGNYAEDPTAQ